MPRFALSPALFVVWGRETRELRCFLGLLSYSHSSMIPRSK